MRIVEKNPFAALDDPDKFWMILGTLQADAWLNHRDIIEDITFETTPDVIQAMHEYRIKDNGVEALNAYVFGIGLVLDQALNAFEPLQDKPEEKSLVRDKLLEEIGKEALLKVTLQREKRMVERNTVTEHAPDGRIRSWIKEHVEM